MVKARVAQFEESPLAHRNIIKAELPWSDINETLRSLNGPVIVLHSLLC